MPDQQLGQRVFTPTTTEGVSLMDKYRCVLCGYVYDQAVGDPEGGVEAGTVFHELPESWACPECGAGLDEFETL